MLLYPDFQQHCAHCNSSDAASDVCNSSSDRTLDIETLCCPTGVVGTGFAIGEEAARSRTPYSLQGISARKEQKGDLSQRWAFSMCVYGVMLSRPQRQVIASWLNTLYTIKQNTILLG